MLGFEGKVKEETKFGNDKSIRDLIGRVRR